MPPPPHPITVSIEGMTCASCSARVEKVLKQLPGVTDAVVNLATETATVSGDTDIASVQRAIEKAGFSVPAESCTLDITGMTCASCSARVEKALNKVPGVLDASVNLATEQATVKLAKGISAATLIAAVERAGYGAQLPQAASATPAPSTRALPDWWPVALAMALSLPLIAPMLGSLFGTHWMQPGWLPARRSYGSIIPWCWVHLARASPDSCGGARSPRWSWLPSGSLCWWMPPWGMWR